MVLNKLPKFVRIDFAGMSEPWLNPDCTNMIEYALKSGFEIVIYTTLYKMTENDCDRLLYLIDIFKSQIQQLCLHLPDNSNIISGWRYSEEYEKVLIKLLNISDDTKQKVGFYTVIMDVNGELHKDLKHIYEKYKKYFNITTG